MPKRYDGGESCRAVIGQCLEYAKKSREFDVACEKLRERLDIPDDLIAETDTGNAIGFEPPTDDRCCVIVGDKEDYRTSQWLDLWGESEVAGALGEFIAQAREQFDLPYTAEPIIRAFILYRVWPKYVPHLEFDIWFTKGFRTDPPASSYGKSLFRAYMRSWCGVKGKGRPTKEQAMYLEVTPAYQTMPGTKIRRRRRRSSTVEHEQEILRLAGDIVKTPDTETGELISMPISSRMLVQRIFDSDMGAEQEITAANRIRKIRSRMRNREFKK